METQLRSLERQVRELEAVFHGTTMVSGATHTVTAVVPETHRRALIARFFRDETHMALRDAELDAFLALHPPPTAD